jgi:hypothetical protein
LEAEEAVRAVRAVRTDVLAQPRAATDWPERAVGCGCGRRDHARVTQPVEKRRRVHESPGVVGDAALERAKCPERLV